jgi:hypothetical protein
VLVLHKDYLLAIDHMFAAVDAGATTLATKIDGAEVDPRFDAVESLVIAASDSHHAEAFRRLDDLANVQRSVLAATPLVFAIGIALVVFFSRVLRAQGGAKSRRRNMRRRPSAGVKSVFALWCRMRRTSF